MSEVEKKRTFNKLKHELEPWRDVLIYMDSFIIWEKSYYPAILCTVISLFYILLWTLDISIITMASIIGLIIISVDFGYSSVPFSLFKSAHWNTEKEIHFERVVTKIITIKENCMALYKYFSSGQKSTKFGVIISLALLIVAYIGAVFNNLFIMYIFSMTTAMYPGIKERKIVNRIKDNIRFLLNSKYNKLLEKKEQ